MNTANKLTILRVLLIPLYVLFLMVEISHYHYWIALIIFIITAVTDALDGKIARKQNMVTDFGKFADPIADKLLVLSAMICFVQMQLMPGWICIIITAREIIISGLRLICAGKGTVIAASWMGKIKTVTQMVFIILTTLQFSYYFGEQLPVLSQIIEILRIAFMYIALVMTIISLIDYYLKNRALFSFKDL